MLMPELGVAQLLQQLAQATLHLHAAAAGQNQKSRGRRAPGESACATSGAEPQQRAGSAGTRHLLLLDCAECAAYEVPIRSTVWYTTCSRVRHGRIQYSYG